MSQIKLLANQVINQIAAGEVIARPESVVKELVENAIDAGASEIRIALFAGGKSLISISDNGVGIAKDELHLAIQQHATSKLQNIEDLLTLHSFGFRGEALASISSVAEIKIISTQQDQTTNILIKNSHGELTVASHDQQLPRGTIVEVKDIFANIPARQKFLKSDNLEYNYIYELVRRLTMLHSDISFILSHNNKVTLRSVGIDPGDSAQLMKHAQQIYPKAFEDLAYYSVQSSVEQQALIFPWFIEQASILINTIPFQAIKNQVTLIYLNGRMIKDKIIMSAIKQALTNLAVTPPSWILFLKLDLSSVDINVHPAKEEVRYLQARELHAFIYQFFLFIYNCQQQNNPLINRQSVDCTINKTQFLSLNTIRKPWEKIENNPFQATARDAPPIFAKRNEDKKFQVPDFIPVEQQLFHRQLTQQIAQNHQGNYLNNASKQFSRFNKAGNYALNNNLKQKSGIIQRLEQINSEQSTPRVAAVDLQAAKMQYLTTIKDNLVYKLLGEQEEKLLSFKLAQIFPLLLPLVDKVYLEKPVIIGESIAHLLNNQQLFTIEHSKNQIKIIAINRLISLELLLLLIEDLTKQTTAIDPVIRISSILTTSLVHQQKFYQHKLELMVQLLAQIPPFQLQSYIKALL